MPGIDLDGLPAKVRRPGYDRGRVTAGIVHFSVGNFHRAHQAEYVDRCLHLPGQAGWGICGVGLIDSGPERAKARSMAAQAGLYTLTLFPAEGEPSTSVVGSIVDYRFAPDDPGVVLAKLLDPGVRLVSMTITEGAYNLDEATGEFRLDAPGIVRDLANPEAPSTVFGFIVAGLARRRAEGLPTFSVLSCDNLQHNGEVARHAVLAFARARDPELARWIEGEAAFPSCMVDRITPAVAAEDVARLNRLTGVADEVPVFAEDFTQWVVEDRFCAGRPPLEEVGVQLTDDVGAYEQVKLRMLNASHSMLSYPGLLGGYRFVHEAMGDARISQYLRAFLDRDVIPLLAAPTGMPLAAYRDTVLTRFSNPAVNDQLARITADGASKIPVFLGDTIRAALDRGAGHERLAFLFAAYARYLSGVGDRGAAFTPQEPRLSEADRRLAAAPEPAAALRMAAFAGLALDRSPAFVAGFARCRDLIAERGALPALAAVLEQGTG